MQLVQTRIRLGAPFTSALTFCKFTFQRRRVTLCACEMLFPNCGPFPQMSHTCAIALLQIWGFRTAALLALTNRRRLKNLLEAPGPWSGKRRECARALIFSA